MGLFAWFKRAHVVLKSITLTTSESTTGYIDARSYAGGTVRVSAGVTTLTFYEKQTEDDTVLPYYNKDGDTVTLTVASTQATQLPPEFYDMSFCVVKSNAGGTATFALKG